MEPDREAGEGLTTTWRRASLVAGVDPEVHGEVLEGSVSAPARQHAALGCGEVTTGGDSPPDTPTRAWRQAKQLPAKIASAVATTWTTKPVESFRARAR